MRHSIYNLILGIAIGCLVFLSSYIGLFTGTEARLQDTLFSSKPINDSLVIVAIDDASLQELGQWPWPRHTFGEFFSKLNEAPPKIVGFDVLLAENSRLGREDDRSLEKSLSTLTYPTVFPVEACEMCQNGLLTPLEAFTKNPQVSLGNVNLFVDPDGVVRNLPEHVHDIEPFAYVLAPEAQETQSSSKRIVYADAPHTLPRISFKDALERPELLENKIVLIGATAPDFHDEHLVPTSDGTLMSGVEIHAHIANMRLEGYAFNSLLLPYVFLWILILGGIAPLAFLIFRRTRAVLIAVALGAIISLILQIRLFETGTLTPLLHIHLAWIISSLGTLLFHYIHIRKKRHELEQVFSRYVSPQVLDTILAHPESVTLGGEEKHVTVLFSDIRSFTTLSEATQPKELVDILNTHFTAMTDVILKHGGVLDKYIGDAIMAFWGAPLENEQQHRDAVAAAHEMIQKLDEVNETLTRQGKPTLAIGIGIYSGTAVVGNIGSEKRFDYTVIGDTVNVAARLEGLTKEYKTPLIIGDATYKKLKDTSHFKQVDTLQVKGRHEPVTIYADIKHSSVAD